MRRRAPCLGSSSKAATCVSPTRFYVQSGIYDAFLKGFAERTQKVKVGDGLVFALGGRLTALDGVATHDGGNALASNGHVHDAALTVLRGERLEHVGAALRHSKRREPRQCGLRRAGLDQRAARG